MSGQIAVRGMRLITMPDHSDAQDQGGVSGGVEGVLKRGSKARCALDTDAYAERVARQIAECRGKSDAD